MRPIYERDHDRVAQAQAVGALARATGTEAMPTPPLTFYDYEMLRDGKPVAIVEIKCRTKQYDPFWVSHEKMVRLHCEARQRSLAGILLVQWPDMTGWLAVDKLDYESWPTATGGRTDRDDPKDIERMAEFPLSWFTTLEVA
jgi:hypothetical protein